MKVKNDFPNVDVVLRRLREFVSFLNEKKEVETDPKQKARCDRYLKEIDEFIENIGNYLDSVCNDDDKIRRAREKESTEYVRELIVDLDKDRTRYHSSIIKGLVMIDRYSVLMGRDRIFDYSGEYANNYAELTPHSPEEKAKMPIEARVKRREMGNFGLYIAASLTAGMSREERMTDEEARAFASCDSDTVKADATLMAKVKRNMRSYDKNATDVLR